MEELIDQLLQLQVETKSSSQGAPAKDPSTLVPPPVPPPKPLPTPFRRSPSAKPANPQDIVVTGECTAPAPVMEDLLVGPVTAPPPHGTHRLQRLDPWDQATGMEQFLKAPIAPTTLSGEVYAERTLCHWVNPRPDFMGFPRAGGQEGEKVEVLSWERYQAQLARKWEEKEAEYQAQHQAYDRRDLAVEAKARKDCSTHLAPRKLGQVITFQLRGGWGFIKEPRLYAEVFVNRQDVELHLLEGHPDRDLYRGDIVTYTRHFGEKGWFALDVNKKRDPVVHQAKAPAQPSPVATVSPCGQTSAVTTTTVMAPTGTIVKTTTCTVTTTTTVVAKELTAVTTGAPAAPKQRTVGTQTPVWSEGALYVAPGSRQCPAWLPPPELPPELQY